MQLDQFLGRIVLIEALSPKRLVVPEVFTNRDANFRLVDIEKVVFEAGFEITRVVKDIVFRQQCFVGESQQSLVANDLR